MAIRPAHPQQRPLSALSTLLGVRLDPSTAVGHSHSPNDLGFLSGITLDSRSVKPGDLYVALAGARVHGAAFCADAVAAGAVAVLTDPDGRARAAASGVPVFVLADPRARLGEIACWVYGDPSSRLRLIGVTGTSGKTTSTYLLESGLRMAGHLTGLIGGVELRIGPERLASSLTTPEAPDLQALFAVMVERGVTAAAMEVSSHSLSLGRVAGTSFDVAVFTNLSQDHLDFHADLEDYFRAKASLFMPPVPLRGGLGGSSPRVSTGIGVVNIDDKYGRKLASSALVPVTTFSASGADEADWRAADVRSGADGSTFRLIGPGGVEADVSLGLAGVFNVANAVGALVALVEAGVRLEDAVAGVAACPGVPGRLERVPAPGLGVTAFVDYSHKPGAVEAVLRSLRPVTQGNLIIVLGCGGDRDRAKRPMMGAAAASLADVAILTSDNPRSEDPLAILAAMLDGVLSVPQEERARVIIEPDRAAAIAQAVALASPGDVVVVAGKGHETGQYVAGSVLPFDDREVTADRPRPARQGAPVIPLSLARIAQVTGGQLRGDPDAVVSGEVVIDSRRAGPGGLFAAVAGERSDGHDFAAAAVAAGATAVLATRPVPVPSVLVADVPAALAALARFVVDALPAVRIAGITGSSGKTSTKDLAAQLVERLGPTIAPAGSYNNEFGHPLTVLRADASTRYLVLELSARGIGHIAHLCRIAPPRYGVVLNVGHAHAGEFGGLDQVARAKGELAEALPADGTAILNAGDPRVLAMAARTQARVVTFGDAGSRRLGPGGGRAARRPRAAQLHAADTRRFRAGNPTVAWRA